MTAETFPGPLFAIRGSVVASEEDAVIRDGEGDDADEDDEP